MITDWKEPSQSPGRKATRLRHHHQADYLDANFPQKRFAIPAMKTTFRRLHLNQWTEQSTRWLPM